MADLITAARNGMLEEVKRLLKESADVNAEDSEGWTALGWAAAMGHLEGVRLLLQQGADVNAGDDRGWTTLLLATHNGHVDVVHLLVESGADIELAEKYFKSKELYQEMVALSRWVRRRGLVALRAE